MTIVPLTLFFVNKYIRIKLQETLSLKTFYNIKIQHDMYN